MTRANALRALLKTQNAGYGYFPVELNCGFCKQEQNQNAAKKDGHTETLYVHKATYITLYSQPKHSGQVRVQFGILCTIMKSR